MDLSKNSETKRKLAEDNYDRFIVLSLMFLTSLSGCHNAALITTIITNALLNTHSTCKA